jgi:hypothetical protein
MMSFRIRCIAGLACIRVTSDSLTLSEVAAVDDTKKKNCLRTFWHFSWPGIRADHLGSN